MKKQPAPAVITPEDLRALAAIIDEAENMRAAYFFRPPCNAAGRRSYERRHSHAAIAWQEGGHAWTAEYGVACSCANVYASGTYTRDGQRTTLTAIRNSYGRMAAAQQPAPAAI